MELRRIAGALGAELLGVDLRSLTDCLVADIRKALLDHLVIFFRDQELTPAQYMAFARRMGKPVEYPFVKGIEGFSEIIEVKKLEHEKQNFGGIWHSDTAYLDVPPMGSMLLARQVPPFGGDTLFANQYAAYEALSEGMKKLLDGLVAVNASSKADVTRTREDRIAEQGGDRKEYLAEHPVVRTHPETGRKALYLGDKVKRFDGLTEDESAPLIKYLNEHATRHEFVYRHQWRKDDIIVWDNRCTMHLALGDFDETQRRHLERTTVLGTPSGYVVAQA